MRLIKFLALIISLFLSNEFCGQDWSYESGTKLVNQFGVSGNGRPGGRYGGMSWKNASGILYLFGGQGRGCTGSLGNLNDLWKYTLSTKTWTQVKGSSGDGQVGVYGTQGISATANTPGARVGSATWQDINGNFWLFGGSYFNDLWKYNPITNEWTWINGSNTSNQNGIYGTIGVSASSNKPGGRMDMVYWTDNNGNFWLFGGHGFAETGSSANGLNDLWKYNPTINEWTWVGGSKLVAQSGVYGTLGVPSQNNIPGNRTNAIGWTDNNNNLWLFGGANRNDLWRYNISTNEWTWMKGSNTLNQTATWVAVNSLSNTPGGMVGGASISDIGGNFLLFGGYGYGLQSNAGNLNDLWQYDVTNNVWNWVKGGLAINQQGIYGVIGVPDQANFPGGRSGSTVWKDSNGKLWMYGGTGYAESGQGQLADLWKIDANAVGIKENKKDIFFSYFPNPSTCDLEITSSEEINLELINGIGEVQIRIQLNNSNNYKYYITNLSSGLYFLKNQNSRVSKKIIILR